MNDKPKELEEHSAQIFEFGCMERPVYLKEDVDAVIAELKRKLQDQCISCPVKMQEDDVVAELKAENERLNNALDKEQGETIKYMDELCNAKNEIERLTIDKRNAELRADVAYATVEKLKTENAELKAQLESEKASRYADSVDDGMRERRLKRALYKACANWAHFAVAFFSSYATKERWHNMENKCIKKAEEY